MMGAKPVCLQPWLENSYRLVTWYDMLQFSADSFAWAWRQLKIIRSDVLLHCATCMDGEVVYHIARDLEDRTRTLVINSAETLERSFRSIELRITADTIKELAEELARGNRHTSEWLNGRIEGIERLATKELSGRAFFYIPDEKLRFWITKDNPYPLGEATHHAFQSAEMDAAEAGVCLAVARPTASVFHSMRVLEVGLSALERYSACPLLIRIGHQPLRRSNRAYGICTKIQFGKSSRIARSNKSSTHKPRVISGF